MDDRSTVSGSFPFDTLGMDLSLDDITEFTEILKDGWLDPFGDTLTPRYLLARSRNNSSNSLKNLVSDNSVTNSNNNSKSSDASSSEFKRSSYVNSISAVSRDSHMARRSILMSPQTKKKAGHGSNKVASLNHHKNSSKVDVDDDSQDFLLRRDHLFSSRDMGGGVRRSKSGATNAGIGYSSLIPFPNDDGINQSEVIGVWQTMTKNSIIAAASSSSSSGKDYKGRSIKGSRKESKKKRKVDKTGQGSGDSSKLKSSPDKKNKSNSANSSRSSSSSGDPFLVSDYNECEDQYSDFNSEDDLGSMHSGDGNCAGDGKVGYEKAVARAHKMSAALGSARGRADSIDRESKRSQSFSEDSADASDRGQSPENPLDEKAKEKSRYHAKNTRMRKKNYIESIREKVRFISYEREQALSTRKQIFNRMLDDLSICRSHLSVFLRLMLGGETSPDIWHHIVEPHILLVMPVTPYRSYLPCQLREGRRHVFGVKELAAESCSFSVFVQSIGDALDDGGAVQAEYDIDESSIVFENNILMCKFVMETSNAVSRGAKEEVCNHGMIYAKFSSQNKIQYVEMVFDVWAVMHDLRVSSGLPDLPLVPNTLALACCNSSDIRVVVSAAHPHGLLYASTMWIEETGYTASDVEKLSLLDVVNITNPGPSKSRAPGSPGGAATIAAVRKAAAGCASMHSCSLLLHEGTLAQRFCMRLFPLVHSEEARDADFVLMIFSPLREVVSYMCIEEPV